MSGDNGQDGAGHTDPVDRTTLPFLMYLSSYRISSDPQLAIDTEIIGQSFDHSNDPSTRIGDDGPGEAEPNDACRRNFRLPVPILTDSANPFEVELRARLRRLSSCTRDTRRLVKMQALLEELDDTAPVSASCRAWLEATTGAMRECFPTAAMCGITDGGDAIEADVGDPPEMVSPLDDEDSSDLLNRFQIAQQALHGALDTVDKQVATIIDTLRLASSPVTRAMETNFAWLRDNAALLGLQCTSSSRCPVCLVNQVTRFNDPCGHTLCTACMQRSNNECCICRTPVQHKRRLFGLH